MTTDSTFEDYQYIRRSTRRQALVEQMHRPMTATQLAHATGMDAKTVSKVIAEMHEYGLVTCLAPDAQRCRPYTLTQRGEKARLQLCEVMGLPTQASTAPTPTSGASGGTSGGYGEVCHRHRAAVVRGLGQPRQACQIKKWILSHLPEARISANNIRDVIRDLRELGVVEQMNDDVDRYPVYRLTDTGEYFRGLLDQANAGQTATLAPSALAHATSNGDVM